MKKINLALIFHLHQPVGNFPEIMQAATEKAYKPLLSALSRHELPFAVHISGPLWEYFDENYPEIFDLVRDMSERGILELMGGGFYEPVLPVIPDRDGREQLEWMADFLEGEFLQRPEGVWLAERIWEPQLPEILANSGVRYTAVDDYHFKSVGLDDDELFGYYITEHVGKKVAIFPISERLRYLMPFSPPEATIDYLNSIASISGRRIAVFGDDGEKFGLWPQTDRTVWQEGWFEHFLDLLEQSESINVISPLKAMETIPPKGNIYLPTGSYFEMGEWTLPPKLGRRFQHIVRELDQKGDFEAWQPFIRGGFWRNFLHKYPESNWMHKRMLFVSRRLHREVFKMPETVQEEAERALYRAQCNCAYWHGIFGGLHMPHLRKGIWDNMLQTEALLGKPASLPIVEDIDADGRDEILIATQGMQVWIRPHSGGMVEELSLPQYAVNLTDTLTRREEIYHNRAKDSHIESHLTPHENQDEAFTDIELEIPVFKYDRYKRRMFTEHILPVDTTLDGFRENEYPQLASFHRRDFKVNKVSEAEVELMTSEMVGEGGDLSPFELTKAIVLSEEDNSMAVNYTLINKGSRREFLFAIETNFGLLSPDDPDRYLVFPGATMQKVAPGARQHFHRPGDFEVRDRGRNLRIHTRTRADNLWMFPVHTIAKSQRDYLNIYQQTSLIHLYKVELDENQSFTTKINLWFQPLSEGGKDIPYPGLFDY